MRNLSGYVIASVPILSVSQLIEHDCAMPSTDFTSRILPKPDVCHSTTRTSGEVIGSAGWTWPEISDLSRDLPVLVPVAALEQPGHHMPVFTDSMLLGEVVRRVGESMKDRVLIAPLMWLGNSHHHMDFQGTLSASPRVYLDLLNDMAETRSWASEAPPG